MTIPLIAKLQKAFVGDAGLVDAADVDVSSTAINGLLANSGKSQAAFELIDATGLGAQPRTFTGSFISNTGNQGVWYGGRQSVIMESDRASANGLYQYEIPDADELNAIFDDMESRGLSQIYTVTIRYISGSSFTITRNALNIVAPSISVGFPLGTFPTTIARGSEATFRSERVNDIILPWARVGITQSENPVATLGDVILRSQNWNNADFSQLPGSGQVLKGYTFPVIGSNPNDGTLRQGLLDIGVSDRIIYDGDFVMWTADTYTSWGDGDNWFVINRDSLRRLSQEASNFLAQTTEIDNRVDVGLVSAMTSNALVWLSENPLAEAPFLTPSTDGNNPRAGDDYAYIGGTENRNAQLQFQFGQNRFNNYLTIGITPSFITGHPESDIYIRVRDDSGDIVQSLNLATDFTFIDDATFTNGTVRHYQRSSTFNYAFLETVEIWLTEVQRHFRIDPDTVDLTQNIADNGVTESLLSSDVRTKLNANLTPTSTSFAAIENRLSPIIDVTELSLELNARFLNYDGTGAYPQSIDDFTEVSTLSPRFTVGETAMFIATPEPGDFVLHNVTEDSVVALAQGQPNVDIIESLSVNGVTYFVFLVTNLTVGHIFEIERTRVHSAPEWGFKIDNLEDHVERIDIELKHPLVNLPDAVVHVIDNQVSVAEEDTPNDVPTPYNNSFSSDNSQTIFYDTNDPAGGFLSSSPIKTNLANDQYRKKLFYVNENLTTGTTVLTAFNDVATDRVLITYSNNQFFARQRVPSIPSGTESSTEYAYEQTGQGQSSDDPIDITPGFPLASGGFSPSDVALTVNRNLPQSNEEITVSIDGTINGNPQGVKTFALPFNGDTNLTYVTNGGLNTELNFRARYSNGVIFIEVINSSSNSAVNGGHYKVLLSYTRTRVVPAVPATTRDVYIADQNASLSNVFVIKANQTGSIIIETNARDVDTGYQFTTVFGGSEDGVLRTTLLTANFFDFRIAEFSGVTIRQLEQHSALLQFGLFTTEYTHATIVDLATQLTVRDENGNTVNVAQQLFLRSPDGSSWSLSADNAGVITTTKVV